MAAVEIAFVCFPYSVADILEAGLAADSAEQELLFGIADSPRLFAESYVSQQQVLASTSHVHVGPFATNPVTRHWSVHAGAQRSLEELYPGRLFFGLAAGDSAVHAFDHRRPLARRWSNTPSGCSSSAPRARAC